MNFTKQLGLRFIWIDLLLGVDEEAVVMPFHFLSWGHKALAPWGSEQDGRKGPDLGDLCVQLNFPTAWMVEAEPPC